MDNLLGKENVFGNVSFCNESRLLWCNDFSEYKPKLISDYLYNQFIKDEVEVDRVELGEIFKILDLGNENDQGVIEFSIDGTLIKDLLNPITHNRSNYIPLFLKEESMKTVFPSSFKRGHIK